MKNPAILLAVAALAGCATQQPGPPNYGTRAWSQAASPGEWQVVSVTPVPPGTGARAAAHGEAGVITSTPAPLNPAPQTVYVPRPVYVPQPVYPAPVYEPNYWWPSVSIGLGFVWGSGHRHHGGHRGWAGGRWHAPRRHR